MTRLEKLIVAYAKYHRDPRNIATHTVGIPTIVFAVLVLLSRNSVRINGVPVTPAMLLTLVTSAWYVSLDAETGLAMTGTNALLLRAAHASRSLAMPAWLALGTGAFAGGWFVQFVGHGYEGRKPAFIDDLKSLAVGPLFVVVEALFALGRKRDLFDTVEREAGSVKKREITAA